MAAVSAIWAGIKKVVEVGQEAEGVWRQLSEWAHAVDNLEQAITSKKSKPPLFKKLKFNDDAAEAMAVLEAENKLATMRAELRERFLYGDLERLGGLDALRRFYQLQRDIRDKRIRAIEEQKIRRQNFIQTGVQITLASAVIGAGIFLIYIMIRLII